MSVEAPRSAPGSDPTSLVAQMSAEKTAALARLAAGVAHELRNPLAVILARAQLLSLALRSGRSPDPEKLQRALETIEEQALRASKVIDSLSMFARPRAPETEVVDLREALDAALALARARVEDTHGVSVDVDVGPATATVVADREQIVTALTQLIVNAFEAMAEGGGRLTIATRRDADGVEVSVRDTGAGVKERDAPRIFEPFFSTKPAAAGLGLSVAQTIAEGHGGGVRLVACGRAGAEFVLRLPAGGRT